MRELGRKVRAARRQLNAVRVHVCACADTRVIVHTRAPAYAYTRVCTVRVCAHARACFYERGARVVAGVCGRDPGGVCSQRSSPAIKEPRVIKRFQSWESWVRNLGRAWIGSPVR